MDATQAMQLALQHHRAGRLVDAETICRQILSQNPNHPDALNLLGQLAGQTGHVDAALDLFARAIRVRPDFIEAHFNLGNAFASKGQRDQAAASFQRVIQLNPNIPEAHNNLGNMLEDLGQLEPAIAAFRRAIQVKPDFVLAHNNLGCALSKQGKFDAAIASLQRAIQIKGDDAPVHYNLGNVAFEYGQLNLAMDSYQRVIQLQPNFAEAHCNVGNIFLQMGRIDQAIAESRRAIQLKPDYAQAHYNLANILLLKGNFQEGWEEYEWRWGCGALRLLDDSFHRSRWSGDNLAGRTILLRSEGGFGDAIHFIRYLPMVAQRGGRIFVECQAELIPLLRQLPGVEQWIAHGQPLPPFDVQCTLISLPRLFGTGLRNIPIQSPTLRADAGLVQTWRSRMTEKPGVRKVGLVWAGSPMHRNDRNRSMPPAFLSPLGRIPDISFYNLRKVPSAERATNVSTELQLIDWTDDIKDFADTAALVANLDLVISVDTAIVHLAGAMGKPVWVMLPFAPEWRWLLNRDDSPWYPTMRLFRQTKPGDWEGVVQRVAESLRELLAGNSSDFVRHKREV